MDTAKERESKKNKILSEIMEFLKDKGISMDDRMRIRHSIVKIRELDHERPIVFNDKWKGYEGYEIKGKNNISSTYEEARLLEIFERMFLPEEVEKKQINQKLYDLLAIVYKLCDYKSEGIEFKLKNNGNTRTN